MINFSNFFITLPKTFQLSLGAGKTNTDFVRFVTILPIFAAKRPDYKKASEQVLQKSKNFINFNNSYKIYLANIEICVVLISGSLKTTIQHNTFSRYPTLFD